MNGRTVASVALTVVLLAAFRPAALLHELHGVAVPLPGGLGAVEFVLVGLVVTLAGVDPAAAAATVVVYRLCSYWFRVALGALASAYSVVGVRELPTDIEKLA
ncbi:flippase-like domain-containing protein [Halarchaeum sp. P4]|uniref:flippase-like domain-containing protein n=1 Tax=Halarchaeum sp. P4 TaxID=3421639 RepID=UPI003EB73382